MEVRILRNVALCNWVERNKLSERLLLLWLVASEALYCSPEKDVLMLSNRKGFIRLALEHGAHLVPVFSFVSSCDFAR